MLGRKVAKLYGEFTILGDKVVARVDQQRTALELLDERVTALDEMIDNGLQANLDKKLPHCCSAIGWMWQRTARKRWRWWRSCPMTRCSWTATCRR